MQAVVAVENAIKLILSFSHFLEPRNAPNVQVVVRWVMSKSYTVSQ